MTSMEEKKGSQVECAGLSQASTNTVTWKFEEVRNVWPSTLTLDPDPRRRRKDTPDGFIVGFADSGDYQDNPQIIIKLGEKFVKKRAHGQLPSPEYLMTVSPRNFEDIDVDMVELNYRPYRNLLLWRDVYIAGGHLFRKCSLKRPIGKDDIAAIHPVTRRPKWYPVPRYINLKESESAACHAVVTAISPSVTDVWIRLKLSQTSGQDFASRKARDPTYFLHIKVDDDSFTNYTIWIRYYDLVGYDRYCVVKGLGEARSNLMGAAAWCSYAERSIPRWTVHTK